MNGHPPTSSTTQAIKREQAAVRPAADISPRGAAAVAGFGLLAMSILAFTMFAAFDNLVVPESAAETAKNILDREPLFRTIVLGLFMIAILDVVVAWALYVFLEPVNRSLALLAAWFRVVYAVVFAVALSNLIVAARLLADADYARAFGAGQSNAQAMMSVNAFNDGWGAALAIFGLHLLVLGYLVFRSGYVPKVLGILVMIAGSGYLIDGFGGILYAGYDADVARFTFVGEALLMGWLLWKGLELRRLVPRSKVPKY